MELWFLLVLSWAPLGLCLLSASARSMATRLNMSPTTGPIAHLHLAEYPDDDFEHILGINDPKHQPSKLQQITALRLKDVAVSKQVVDVQGCGFDPSFFVSAEDLEQDIKAFDAKYGKPLNLKNRLSLTWPDMAIAAEFKKASPSKGDINLNADAVEQCLQYNSMGAAVISVLTEFAHFKGTLTELKRVRLATQEACEASGKPRPAILRKDFVLDRYQILEARSHGADTVLLIVAILGVRQLQDLIAYSREMGMEPLVEVHTQREMEIALECGSKVIGVNNRNLHSFQLDLDTTARAVRIAAARGLSWRPVNPLEVSAGSSAAPDVTIAALSGITSAEDVAGFRDVGVGCCLIGETLMKASDPRATISALLQGGRLNERSDGTGFGAALRPDSNTKKDSESSRNLVKICGLTREQDASAALAVGASLLGVILVPQGASPRAASVAQAQAIVKVARSYGERSTALGFASELSAMRADAATTASPFAWFSAGASLLRRTTLRRPLVVGVFQDQSALEINEAVAATGIDIVQLHGDEPPSLADQIKGAAIVKVLHLPPVGSSGKAGGEDEQLLGLKRLKEQAQQWSGKSLALLLDSRIPGARGGGTGAAFDWSLAQAVGAPVLLAGGLLPSNAGEAASITGVIGVDVSSGVEVVGAPGVKDQAMVASFVRGARGGGVKAVESQREIHSSSDPPQNK